jgi:hypothetical protein
LSFTFFTLVQQSQLIVFSNFEFVRLFREYELMRRYVRVATSTTSPDGFMNLSEVIKVLRMIRDCGGNFSNYYINPDQKRICQFVESIPGEHYQESPIDENVILTKRNPQEKLVEYVINNLLSPDTVIEMLDTLFKDMGADFDIFEDVRKIDMVLFEERENCDGGNHGSVDSHAIDSVEDEEEAESEMQSSKRDKYETISSSRLEVHSEYIDSENDDDEDGGSESSEFVDDSSCGIEDDRCFGRDIGVYVGRKSMLTIERIKDIVAELLSVCPKAFEFKILHYLMNGVIFQQKKLRDSFM